MPKTGRFCYYIPPDQTPDPQYGYRVAVVWENDDGYYFTGDADRGIKPWYWGKTLAEAESVCEAANRKRGLSAKLCAVIVGRSMTRCFEKRK